MKSLAQARVKRVRAVELLAEGKSYDQIARESGSPIGGQHTEPSTRHWRTGRSRVSMSYAGSSWIDSTGSRHPCGPQRWKVI